MDIDALAAAFEGLGNLNPRLSAEASLSGGTAQLDLAREAFLRGAWELIASDEDLSWIDAVLTNTPENSSEPLAGYGNGIRALLQAGADPADIAAVVRAQTAEFLFSLLYQMTDPESVPGNTDPNGAPHAQWGLFRIDPATGEPAEELKGLYESVLTSDPTHREGRPKQPSA